MRLRVLLAAVAAPIVLWLALPLVSAGEPSATASRAGQIEKQIGKTRAKIERRKSREGVLTTDIAAYTKRIRALQADITRLQRRQSRIQSTLDRERSQLIAIQDDLRRERARLVKMRAKLNVSRATLAKRLRALYMEGEPDLVSVVLESDGFAELLESSDFLARINAQDTRIIRAVSTAKAAAKRATTRLDKLEHRQQRVTRAILSQRNAVARVKDDLAGTRQRAAEARAGRRTMLRSVRHSRHELEEDLDELLKEQAKVQAKLQGIPDPGPIRRGSGRFIWPVNGTITSPFCESRSWESCHPGIDIAAPMGTPLRAADSGRVAIAGWVGGYGNYTCIQHTASLSSCYGHQSSIGVSVGQNVSQGQVIGRIGSTGFSTGPHLHFEARINGSVTNPMNYLG
jgi:murein DD-endopeptidase MepM/ murein hydrolase activator NlpD